MPPPVPGVLKPPPHIVAALKRINPRLEVYFADTVGRWVIYERLLNGQLTPVRVLEDMLHDRAYVPLDMGAVEDAAEGDTWRKTSGPESVLDEIQRANRALKEEGRGRWNAAIEEAAGDMVRVLRRRKVFDLARKLLKPRNGLLRPKPGLVLPS